MLPSETGSPDNTGHVVLVAMALAAGVFAYHVGLCGVFLKAHKSMWLAFISVWIGQRTVVGPCYCASATLLIAERLLLSS